MISQIINKLKSLIVRGVIKSINDGSARQMVVASLLYGELKDRIERVQQFGFSSVPPAGASAIFGAVAADRNRLVCLGENHPEYRPTGKAVGETIIYDAFEQFIHLQESGQIEITAAGTVLINAPTKLRIVSPLVEITGDLQVIGDINDRYGAGGMSMNDMRTVYNTHKHPENDSGGPTNIPNEQMEGGS